MAHRLLDQERLSKVFGLYRTITKSHWKDPKIDDVNKSLEAKDRYEFITGPMDKWATKFVITKDRAEGLDNFNFHIEVNPVLPPALKKHADMFVEKFKTAYSRLDA